MIFADTLEQRKAALAKILPMQRGDFEAIYRAMGGLPVTIRLLDPPLHEFLPHEDAEIQELAGEMGVPFEKLKAKVESLHEFNPMLGTRGCRLDVLYPEIAEMQTEAIISAAINVWKEDDLRITPEIMVPLVSEVNELRFVKKVIKLFGGVSKVYCDSAEQVLIRGLRTAMARAAMGDIKVGNARKDRINDRIFCITSLVAQGRYAYTELCDTLEDALSMAVWRPNTVELERLDDGTSDIDTLDGFEYSYERDIRNYIKTQAG